MSLTVILLNPEGCLGGEARDETGLLNPGHIIYGQRF